MLYGSVNLESKSQSFKKSLVRLCDGMGRHVKDSSRVVVSFYSILRKKIEMDISNMQRIISFVEGQSVPLSNKSITDLKLSNSVDSNNFLNTKCIDNLSVNSFVQPIDLNVLVSMNHIEKDLRIKYDALVRELDHLKDMEPMLTEIYDGVLYFIRNAVDAYYKMFKKHVYAFIRKWNEYNDLARSSESMFSYRNLLFIAVKNMNWFVELFYDRTMQEIFSIIFESILNSISKIQDSYVYRYYDFDSDSLKLSKVLYENMNMKSEFVWFCESYGIKPEENMFFPEDDIKFVVNSDEELCIIEHIQNLYEMRQKAGEMVSEYENEVVERDRAALASYKSKNFKDYFKEFRSNIKTKFKFLFLQNQYWHLCMTIDFLSTIKSNLSLLDRNEIGVNIFEEGSGAFLVSTAKLSYRSFSHVDISVQHNETLYRFSGSDVDGWTEIIRKNQERGFVPIQCFTGDSEDVFKVIAIFAYDGGEDELSFREGDEITVCSTNLQEELLMGEMDGRKGMFNKRFTIPSINIFTHPVEYDLHDTDAKLSSLSPSIFAVRLSTA